MKKNPEFRKTILIGLGGAGQQVVLRTKRFFIDNYGVLPPSVKILCLDTDSAVLSEEVQKWYIKPIAVGSITAGAGAVRQNGRLAFYRHINEIRKRFSGMESALSSQTLNSEMESAKITAEGISGFSLSPKDAEIYVCGSLAGGTGSGSFLDTGILLRDLFPNSIIQGYFLLNWIYRNKPFAHRVAGNVYAALSELDNFQSVMYGEKCFYKGAESKPYTVKYGKKEIDVSRAAPYTLFHLIDGRNERGLNYDDLNTLTDIVATSICLSMSSMAYPVASAVDNLIAAINVDKPDLWGNRYARYSSLGVSAIHYPAKELFEVVCAENALDLCRKSLERVESGQWGGPESGTSLGGSPENVSGFINAHQLTRSGVKARVSTNQALCKLDIGDFEATENDFPTSIREVFENEEADLKYILEEEFKVGGERYIADLCSAMKREMELLANQDAATLRRWVDSMTDQLVPSIKSLDEELERINQSISGLQSSCSNMLEAAKKAKVYPFVGVWRTPRGRAVKAWEEKAEKLLGTVKQKHQMSFERKVFQAVIDVLSTDGSIDVPKQTDIADALLLTVAQLRSRASNAKRTLDLLRNKPNEILLEDGRAILYEKSSLNAGVTNLNGLTCSFDQFISDCEVSTPELFIELFRENPDKLINLFWGHCQKVFKYIGKVSVDEAIEEFSSTRDNPDVYKEDLFRDLFRYATPLWRYGAGQINALREGRMGNVLSLGFADMEKGYGTYNTVVRKACRDARLMGDPSYSTTGDQSKVWLLNFAAALPAYFQEGMKEAKAEYEDEIIPTYHIDAELEMNIPDLFPQDDKNNVVLRILGMAIVPGIDVIHDEKLDLGGHEFTINLPEVVANNGGAPKKWRLFRNMYKDVQKDTKLERDGNLLTSIKKTLSTRVQEMRTSDIDGLRSVVNVYIAKVEKKIACRDFSRLVSARLTYLEIQELKRFVACEADGGCDCHFDKYISKK